MIFNTTGVENPLKYIKDGSNESIVEGKVDNNIASGQYSHAAGNATTASATNSFSMGEGSIASGARALAKGKNAHATATDAFASGQNVYATNSQQTVIGKNNVIDGNNNAVNTAFTIGGGNSSTQTKDIFSVDWDGKIQAGPSAFHHYITIPNNTNINSITTFGKYIVPGDSGAQTMTNLPSSYSGILFVIPSGGTKSDLYDNMHTDAYNYGLQIYIVNGGSNAYIRGGNTGTTTGTSYTDVNWGTWRNMGINQNAVSRDGWVPAPTSSKPYYMYATNANGEPNWYGQQNVLSRILMLGDASNFSKDFLNISTTSQFESQNRRAYFTYNDSTKSQFSNIPTQLNLETGYVSGFREVYWITSTDIIVKVVESWPVRGRTHYNRWNGSAWNGWRCMSYDHLESRQMSGVTYNDFTRITVAPLFTSSNLGLESSATDAEFLEAWLKKICAIYPNYQNHIFIANATPNSRRVIICFIYNTGTVNTAGLPEAAFGFALRYANYDTLGVRFGTSSYSFYASTYGKPESTVTYSETVGTDGTTAASGTYMQKGSKTFTPGTYMIKFTGRWASNSSGYRRVMISPTNSTSAPNPGYAEDTTSSAVNGIQTNIHAIAYRKFTSNTTLYFYMYQNSGSSLATYGRLAYVKISNM